MRSTFGLVSLLVASLIIGAALGALLSSTGVTP